MHNIFRWIMYHIISVKKGMDDKEIEHNKKAAE